MNSFVISYPDLIITLIAFLGAVVGWLIKRALNELTAAIKELREGFAENTLLLREHTVRLENLPCNKPNFSFIKCLTKEKE